MTDIQTLLAVADGAAIRVSALKADDGIRARIAQLKAEIERLENDLKGSDGDLSAAEAEYDKAVEALVAAGLDRDKVRSVVSSRVALLAEAGLLTAPVSVPATKERAEAPTVSPSGSAPAVTTADATSPETKVPSADQDVKEEPATPASDDATVVKDADPTPDETESAPVDPAATTASSEEKPASEQVKRAASRPTPSNSMSRARRPSAVSTQQSAPASAQPEVDPSPTATGDDRASVVELEREDQVFGVASEGDEAPLTEDFLTGQAISEENEGGDSVGEAEPELSATPEPEPEPEIDDPDALPAFLR